MARVKTTCRLTSPEEQVTQAINHEDQAAQANPSQVSKLETAQ